MGDGHASVASGDVIQVFLGKRCWQTFALECLPQFFPLGFLVSSMTMIIIQETLPPILAWSWNIAYKTVALHLKNSNVVALQMMYYNHCIYCRQHQGVKMLVTYHATALYVRSSAEGQVNT